MMAPRFGFRCTVTLALQQIALGAVLFVLIAGWLHIPDANVFELVASAVLALMIAALAGVGESLVILKLTGRPANARLVLRGCGVVLAAVALWFTASLWFDHLSVNDGLRAGYVNSRFPAGLRNIFSYEHLILWFGWIWTGLRAAVAGLLAAAAFAILAGVKPLRALAAILRTRRYWLCLFLLTAAAFFSGVLMAWTPGHSLRVQMTSLLIRLPLTIAMDAVAAALLLQAMTGAVAMNQEPGSGEPASSQPRTLGMP